MSKTDIKILSRLEPRTKGLVVHAPQLQRSPVSPFCVILPPDPLADLLYTLSIHFPLIVTFEFLEHICLSG